jgi:nicotinamidase-related amidase
VDVPASLGPRAGHTIVHKPRFGAFFGSSFAGYLEQTQRDTVIVCGISLAGGVETTVRDAYNRDLRSIVVADACICRPVPDQGWGAVTADEVAKVTFSILAQRFARIATTSDICSELSSH